MTFTDLSESPTTARGELIEARFDDTVAVDPTPLIDLVDGRRTNDDLAPGEWLDGLEAVDGRVAVYFGLAADHEWWLGYDPAFEEDDGDGGEYGTEGPFIMWSTYPSGGCSRQRKARSIVETNIEGVGEGCEGSGIRRSRVVRVENGPEFVQSQLR